MRLFERLFSCSASMISDLVIYPSASTLFAPTNRAIKLHLSSLTIAIPALCDQHSRPCHDGNTHLSPGHEWLHSTHALIGSSNADRLPIPSTQLLARLSAFPNSFIFRDRLRRCGECAVTYTAYRMEGYLERGRIRDIPIEHE